MKWLLFLVFVFCLPAVVALTIDPGECENVTLGNLSETVCATSCDCDSEVCHKSKTLYAPDSYSVDTGACDLEFECLSDDGACELVTIPVPLRLVTEENLTQLWFDDELVIHEKYRLNQDRDVFLEFDCPVEVSDETANSFSEATRASFCSVLMNGFVPQLLEQSSAQQASCQSRIDAKDAERQSCQSKLDVCQGEESQRVRDMQDSLLSRKAELNVTSNELEASRVEVARLERSINSLTFGLFSAIIVCFFAVVFGVYMLLKYGGEP